MDRSNRAFAAAWRLTLWLLGALVALMTGMMSAYLVASALYVGSRIYTRMRGLASATPQELGSGGPL